VPVRGAPLLHPPAPSPLKPNLIGCLRATYTGVALALSLLLTACASLSSSARSEFVAEEACPEGRVEVRHPAPKPAPPDVAADPQRAALWQKHEEEWAANYYVAIGCGREHLYLCEHRQMTSEWMGPDCVDESSTAAPVASTSP
jgi:hypothetical protein